MWQDRPPSRLAVPDTRDPLLAKEVVATGGPAAAQAKSNAGCPVSARESPYVTLVTGTRPARAEGRGGLAHRAADGTYPRELALQLAVSPYRGWGTVRTCPV